MILILEVVSSYHFSILHALQEAAIGKLLSLSDMTMALGSLGSKKQQSAQKKVQGHFFSYPLPEIKYKKFLHFCRYKSPPLVQILVVESSNVYVLQRNSKKYLLKVLTLLKIQGASLLQILLVESSY